MKNWQKLGAAILFCQAAGVLGALFTTPAIATWYVTLTKPAWNPPSWLFAPVWTTLFLLMGIALYLIWRTGLNKTHERETFWLFLAHLLVNVAWSAVFFGLESPGLGVLVILILLAFILYLITRFWSINRTAAWLLVPYVLWVAFATVLNFTIWQLN